MDSTGRCEFFLPLRRWRIRATIETMFRDMANGLSITFDLLTSTDNEAAVQVLIPAWIARIRSSRRVR